MLDSWLGQAIERKLAESRQSYLGPSLWRKKPAIPSRLPAAWRNKKARENAGLFSVNVCAVSSVPARPFRVWRINGLCRDETVLVRHLHLRQRLLVHHIGLF